MNIWALADLHLCHSSPEKSMSIFGWGNYMDKICKNWTHLIGKEDLILIAGDISWAKTSEDALADLQWLDQLPGKKIILKGNHDRWWVSNRKMEALLPPSIQFINTNAITINNISIGGARLWDTQEYDFDNYIKVIKGTTLRQPQDIEQSEKIFNKELNRLETSLKQIDPSAKLKVAMTHFPPINAKLEQSKASQLLETYNIDIAVFGHLHSIDQSKPIFGLKNGIKYLLTSADYLNFQPISIRKSL